MLLKKPNFQLPQNSRSLTNMFGGLLDICHIRRVLFAILFFLNAAIAQAFSDLVILGDSLSDTGNHPAAILGAPYPYYENRISNGPVAVDVLAEGLGLTAANSGHIFGNGNGGNYAVSGANAAGNEPHGLNAQLEAFVDGRQSIDGDALYLFMVGGNDVRDAAVIENTPLALSKVTAAADAIQLALQQLVQKGAKTILVSNVPDISQIPETDARAANNPGIHQRAQQLSLAFNQRLAQHLTALSASSSIKLLRYDFYTHFNEILTTPAQYGFSNTTQACFDNSPYYFHPQCDFDEFVFFDSIHPTAKTHQIIGQGMLEVLMRASAVGGLPGIYMLLLEQ